jgi:hypothetical protein
MAGAAEAQGRIRRQGRRGGARAECSVPPRAPRIVRFEASALAAAREAVERLARDHPRASARCAPGPGVLAAGVVAALLTAATAVGCVIGAPLLALPGVAGFLALIVFRLAAAVTRPPRPAPPGPSREAPPLYTVIAPLHREREVAGKLVAALEALDYPPDRLDIKLVLEADDLDTIAAVAHFRLAPQFEVLIAPPGYPRTKPRALNFALASSRSWCPRSPAGAGRCRWGAPAITSDAPRSRLQEVGTHTTSPRTPTSASDWRSSAGARP